MPAERHLLDNEGPGVPVRVLPSTRLSRLVVEACGFVAAIGGCLALVGALVESFSSVVVGLGLVGLATLCSAALLRRDLDDDRMSDAWRMRAQADQTADHQ